MRYLVSVSLLLLGITLLGNGIDHLRKQFKRVVPEFETIYSRVDGSADSYAPGVNYPYRGVAIKNWHKKGELTDGKLYAIYRFDLTPEVEIFLARFHPSELREQKIYAFPYHNTQKKFLKPILMANQYGYEGAHGRIDGWIVDLDHNGVLDFLVRDQSTSTTPAGKVTSEDQFSVTIWKDGGFKTVKLNQPFLKKAFPVYRGTPELSSTEKKSLKKAFKSAPENGGYYGVVIAGKNIKKIRKDVAVKKGESFYFNGKQCDQYRKNGKKVAVITYIYTRNRADLVQKELKSLTGYHGEVVLMKTFCPKPVFNCKTPKGMGCIYECK